MNILEQTEALKDLPDQALIQQMQMPTGEIAPIFITSELRRRKRMRDDYARREAADTPTVAEEVVMAAGMPQGGIADAARALAPKTNMGQNTGMADMMPRAATQAPERMASGGIVRMAKGGRTQVEYNGRGYFVFADGDVQDALGRPVSDELAQAVKASLETPPERQEGTASLGSEILADASPQAPGLESVLSSDRPFSPLSMEVTDTRPAVPSSLGMGGERPSTLTDVTQPAALSEMEKARLATEFTQQQELARAIRNQQEQGIASLNPPSAPAIEATPYDPFIPIEPRIGERSIGVGDTFSRAAEAREQGLDMPDSTRSALLDAMSPASDTFGGDFLGESQARANAAKLKELRNTQPNVDVGTDPRFGDTMGLQEVLAGDFDPVPAAPSAAAKPTDTAGLMALLQEQMTAKTGVSVGDNIGGPMGEAAAALAEVTASGPTQGEKTFNPGTGEMSPALREELNLAPTIEGEVEQLNRAIETATANNNDFLAATLTTKRDTLVKQLQGQELATDVQEAVGGALRTVGEYASDLGGLLATKYREIVTANIDPVKAAGILKEYAQSDEYKFNLREQQAAERENTERAREQRLIDLSGKFPEQPRYDVDQLPGPIGAGTATDPITMGDARVGIEAARPKARPQDVAPVADTTTPTTPDGGGITTVSTKAINDTAKSTGLGVDAWLAIAQGGAAMAASKNPTLLGAFGEGAGVAAAGLQKQRAAEKTAGQAQAKIDATLEAARIRAAAAGKGSKLAATGSTLYPAIVGQLEQKELELATEKSKGRGLNAAKIDSLTKEIESLRERKRQIETASGLLVAAGGTDDVKKISI